MSRDPLRLRDYLGHILEAIERIHNYCEDIDEPGVIGTADFSHRLPCSVVVPTI
jgi:uncharacterized protein with HEPN domain